MDIRESISDNLKDEEILAMSLKAPSFFGELVDRYEDAFLRAAFKIVKNKEDAEDIVQEAFTKVYLNAGRFKQVEGASFKSWAYKIVINTSFSHYKKLKKARESVINVEPDESFQNKLESSVDMQILIFRVLPKMPKHLGMVLKKYYLEDKSQKDIAGEENITPTAVKMRLFRAKKMFKELIEADSNLSWII